MYKLTLGSGFQQNTKSLYHSSHKCELSSKSLATLAIVLVLACKPSTCKKGLVGLVGVVNPLEYDLPVVVYIYWSGAKTTLPNDRQSADSILLLPVEPCGGPVEDIFVKHWLSG